MCDVIVQLDPANSNSQLLRSQTISLGLEQFFVSLESLKKQDSTVHLLALAGF